MSHDAPVLAVPMVSESLICSFCAGSGFISSDYYLHGFFSASIKLPKDYTAGVVVAFYVSIPSPSMLQHFHFISEHSVQSKDFLIPLVYCYRYRTSSVSLLLFRAVGSCLVTWRCQHGFGNRRGGCGWGSCPKPAEPSQVAGVPMSCAAEQASKQREPTWAVWTLEPRKAAPPAPPGINVPSPVSHSRP